MTHLVGRAWVLAVALCITLVGTAAAEENGELPPCPENSQQYATQIKTLFTTQSPISDDALNDAKLLRVVCADEFVTMYELSDAWYQLSQRPELGLEDKGNTANIALAILIEAANAPFVEHNYEAASEFRDKVVSAVVTYIDLGGPVPAYLEPGADFGSCDNYWGNSTQTLWYDYKKEWTGTARPMMIQNASLSCRDKPRNYAHRWFGELRLAQAVAEADPDKAFELAKDARAAFALSAGDDMKADSWSSIDQPGFERTYNQLALATRANAVLLSDEAIFAAENVATEKALYDLAWKVNDAWPPLARDEAGSAVEGAVTARLTAYYERVKALETLAQAESLEARQLLFDVLKGHAEKTYRTRATVDEADPPQVIWAARDPSGETGLGISDK